MKRWGPVSLLALFLLAGGGPARASPTQVEISPVTFALDFSATDLQFSYPTLADVTYNRVTYPKTEPSDEVGKPELPFRRVQLLIPPEAVVTGLTVTELITQEVAGTFTIVPVQPPAPCWRPWASAHSLPEAPAPCRRPRPA